MRVYLSTIMIHHPFWNTSNCFTKVTIVTTISRTLSMIIKIVFMLKINCIFDFKTWKQFLIILQSFSIILYSFSYNLNIFSLIFYLPTLTKNHLFVLCKEVVANGFFSSFIADVCSKLSIRRLLLCVTVSCFASTCSTTWLITDFE